MFSGTADTLKFATGGSERLRIGSSGNVGINNSSPTQRLETNGNAQFNAYDNGSGAGGYYTAKGLLIGNAFDAGLSGGNDDRNAIVWNERGTDLLFGTTNLERLRIDYAGNVGIGVTPEAWTTFRVLQLGGESVIRANTASNEDFAIGRNMYYDGSWKRINTAHAQEYLQDNSGSHLFRVAASGSADSAISWTTAMDIANNGKINIGVGNASNHSRLNISSPSDLWAMRLDSGSGSGYAVKFYHQTTNVTCGSIRTTGIIHLIQHILRLPPKRKRHTNVRCNSTD